MDKRLFFTGVAILLVGTLLIFAFWPLISSSAESVHEDRDGLLYDSYEQDDTIMIRGTITDIREDDYPDWMEDIGFTDSVYVELDDNFSFVVSGQSSIDFSEGDLIYARFILREDSIAFGIGTVEYWELDGEIRSKRTIDYIFYTIAGAGVIIAAAGAVKV